MPDEYPDHAKFSVYSSPTRPGPALLPIQPAFHQPKQTKAESGMVKSMSTQPRYQITTL